MNKQPIRVLQGDAKPFEPFWRVMSAEQTGGQPEISFMGSISEYSWMGDEITPKKFKDDLYEIGKNGPVTIRMHSGGGEIFAASAIRSMLLDYPGEVTVCIEGLCASAAVAVALAGNKVQIRDTAYMMIHNPLYSFFMASLDAETMDKFAAELRVFKDGILGAYESRTGLEREEISGMMDAETWMTANKAVELGFADEVLTGGKPVKVDVSAMNYVNVPSVLLSAAVIEPKLVAEIDGLEPVESVAVNAEAQARKDANASRLTAVKNFIPGEVIMNIRQKMNDRAAAVARAEELMVLAEGEERDFTEEEQVEFSDCLAKAETLSAEITNVQEKRTRLKAQVELVNKQGNVSAPELPQNNVSTVKTRAEFNSMSAVDQAAFIRGGGKLQDQS